MSDLVMLGGGGHARDVYECLREIAAGTEVSPQVAMILDDYWKNKERFEGCPVKLVLGIEKNLKPGDSFIASAGYPKTRKILIDLAIRKGLYAHKPVIHPKSLIASNCHINKGVIVLGGAILSPNVVLGQYSTVGAGAVIGHDTSLGENVSIMPGAVISGDVILENDVMLGAGATVLEKVRIGKGAVVGAGAVVTKNVPDGETVVGSPARPIASRRF